MQTYRLKPPPFKLPEGEGQEIVGFLGVIEISHIVNNFFNKQPYHLKVNGKNQ